MMISPEYEVFLLGGPRSSEIIIIKELSPYIDFPVAPKEAAWNFPDSVTVDKNYRILRYERKPGHKISGYEVYKYINQ